MYETYKKWQEKFDDTFCYDEQPRKITYARSENTVELAEDIKSHNKEATLALIDSGIYTAECEAISHERGCWTDDFEKGECDCKANVYNEAISDIITSLKAQREAITNHTKN